MKKEQLQVLKDAITNLDEAKSKLGDAVEQAMGDIEKEMENIDKLQTEIQEEFDDLSEKQQESEKGEKLTAIVEALDEVSNEFGSLKDAFESDPFEDVISAIQTVIDK